MPSDTRNVKLGVCTVTFDGVDLGYTKGGVEVEVATETHKVMVDQFGNSEINELITGRTCKAKIPLAETTLANLARIMPGSTLYSTGGAKSSGTVTFSVAAAANDDTVTVNGVVFTFKTTPDPTKHEEMALGATFSASATNLKNAINDSINPLVSRVTATVNAGVVTITADDDGTAGDLITLAKTGTNIAVSGATLTGGADPTILKVDVPNGVGISLLDYAKKLVLHPQGNLPSNRSEDFVIPLAMTPGAATFAYKLDDERIFNCEFTAYPDPVTRTLFVVGDENAT